MFYDFHTSERMQSLDKRQHRLEEGFLVSFTLVIIGMCIGMVMYGGFRYMENEKTKPLQNCNGCHERINSMAEYFRKSGSKDPQGMANAVLATRNPRLMAAVAKIETRGNHDIRKAGYRKRHDGAFQVNSRYWGEVPNDPVFQALQAEAILDELTSTMPLDKALAVYGGDSSNRYSKRVLAELVEVPR